MNPYVLPLVAVLGVFALGALGAAWWHQKRHIRHLQGLLGYNEQSRRALAEQLLALRQRLDEGSDAIVSDLDSDLAARRREMERVLAARETVPAPAATWQETLPAGATEEGVDFLLTQPGELDEAPAR